MKKEDHESLLAVDDWPTRITGRMDVFDVGDPLDHELDSPSHISANFEYLDGSDGPGVYIPGAVLLESGIPLEELENGSLVTATIVRSETLFSTAAIDGKLLHEYGYEVIDLQRT